MPSNHKSSIKKLKKELNSSLSEENRKTAMERAERKYVLPQRCKQAAVAQAMIT